MGRLYNYLDKIKFIIKTRKHIGPVFLLGGTPLHGNLGDSAIVMAEKNFISKFSYTPVELTSDEIFGKYARVLKYIITPRDTILLHGGGNMGDEWFSEEWSRRQFISKHPNKKIVIFPQTIHYSDSPDGYKKSCESIVYYNRPNVTIVAREKPSYVIMKSLYPQANILLTPDIVLSSDPYRFNIKRKNVLLCMRRDSEKSITESDEILLQKALNDFGLNYSYTDTVIPRNVSKSSRESEVESKLKELAGAKLVITDRLHGMIFCAITETPCIVLSNYNHKVKGTYNWISYLPYVKYADSIEKAISMIPDVLSLDECIFENERILKAFEPLREVLFKK